MTTRRGFLTWLTAGAAAGPAVAQEVAQSLSRGASLRPGVYSPNLVEWDMPTETKPKRTFEDPIEFIRANGFPDWAVEKIRHQERANAARGLDPDIKVARSFSESSKRRMQIERNVQRRLRHMRGDWDFNDIERQMNDRFSWWPF